jgi:CheY-like chemotaxis protein
VRGRETILLVEDEPNLRELTARLLMDLGYRVLVAPGLKAGATDLLLPTAAESMARFRRSTDSLTLGESRPSP